MTDSSLAYSADLCRNFPLAPAVIIERDSLLSGITRAFNSDVQIICLDGEEGAGKSQALAQFMRLHPTDSVGLFFSPISRDSYSTTYVRLALSEQLHWVLDGTRLDEAHIDEGAFRSLIYQLQKKAKKSPHYFVIDGLDEIPAEYQQGLSDLLDILPFGYQEFKFLVSGSQHFFDGLLKRKIPIKVFQALAFNPDETKKFLLGLSLTDDQLAELHHFCSGIPGHLSIARRLLLDNMSFSDLLDQERGSLSSLFELQWTLVPQDSTSQYILALVAFCPRAISAVDISRITGLPLSEAREFCDSCRLLSIDTTNEVRFASEAQHRFASQRLLSQKTKVNKALVEDLLSDPKSSDAIRHLPSQLASDGRYSQVISTLKPEHFLQLLKIEQSLSSLKQQVKLGHEAAVKVEQIAPQLGFAITNGVVLELDFATPSQHQIRALLKLDRFNEAVALALGAPTKEDRLHLLSIVARHTTLGNKNAPKELREHVVVTAKTVDFQSLGERGIEIACDLVAIDPDLALELVEATTRLLTNPEEQEVAFAALYIAASDSSTASAKQAEVAEHAKSRITDSHLQQFSEAVAATFSKYTAKQVIERISRMNEQHRLFFIRRWLARRKRQEDAIEVAEFALDFLLRDVNYTPKFADFLAIAQVIPFVKNVDKTAQLIKRLESQHALAPANGTTEDSVQLRMLILHGKMRVSEEDARASLTELYLEAADIKEIGVRTACLGWMLHHLQTFESLEQLDAETDVVRSVSEELCKSIKILLEFTADHYEAAKRPIHALSARNPAHAIALASQLNSESRRNKSLRDFIVAHLRARTYASDVSHLLVALDKITDPRVRDRSTLTILVQIAQHARVQKTTVQLEQLLDIWRKPLNAETRCRALVLAHRIAYRCYPTHHLVSGLTERLQKEWDAIPRNWFKLETGYWVAEELADFDKQVAEKWLAAVRKEGALTVVNSEELADLLQGTIRLAVRAFSGLIRAGREAASFEKIVALIEGAPSDIERSELWSDLAIRAWACGNQTVCTEAVNRLRTIIDQPHGDNQGLKDSLITFCAAALYVGHAATAERLINSISSPIQRDEAYEHVCHVLLTRMPHTEPGGGPEAKEFDLSPETVTDAIRIISHISTDSTIFGLLEELTASLVAKRNLGRLTRAQVTDSLVELERLVKAKLPDQNNIQHEGYLIAAEATILKAQSTCQKVELARWEELQKRANEIVNVADRVVATSIVASCCASKFPEKSRQWLTLAMANISIIPSDLDKVDRYQWVAELSDKVDRNLSQNCFREAMLLTKVLGEQQDISGKQRRIFDLAHSFDPRFAETLIDLFDADEARRESKNVLKRQLRLLNSKKKAASPDGAQSFDSILDKDLPDTAWLSLGSLLAKRATAKSMSAFSDLMARSSSFPLSKAFPIWSWILENANVKLSASDTGGKSLEAVFESVDLMAQLTRILIQGTDHVPLRNVQECILRDGDRDIALTTVRDWLRKQQPSAINISDPYFGPSELELIQLIAEEVPAARIRVLTSKEHIKKVAPGALDEAFQHAWASLCDFDPPSLEIVVVGVGHQGKHPIHERWIVSDTTGLRFGTSINAAGIGRTSEITAISAEGALIRNEEMSRFLDRHERLFHGERISYTVLELG